jgi:Hypervirulence associated proteins TUDOR domain
MVKQFAVGDRVRWNSEAGYVEGVIIKIHTHNVEYKGYVHHATESDPQYEIKSDKTDHIAMHKGSALTKLLEREVWRTGLAMCFQARSRGITTGSAT